MERRSSRRFSSWVCPLSSLYSAAPTGTPCFTCFRVQSSGRLQNRQGEEEDQLGVRNDGRVWRIHDRSPIPTPCPPKVGGSLRG
ncbi:uncharacterized protein M6B38_204890 [Iris pallida]|uniref:Secreted protein n=1 Tax=Iris pallida TaxID=29817 RepID=A0AAX6E7R5_IRIPA|nr:uncharacterized protein M6B38_204890 [Iris pallida]